MNGPVHFFSEWCACGVLDLYFEMKLIHRYKFRYGKVYRLVIRAYRNRFDFNLFRTLLVVGGAVLIGAVACSPLVIPMMYFKGFGIMARFR